MFKRISLPYDYDALEPYIDATTVEVHYEKHHKTYTEKFNDLVRGVQSLKGMTAEGILMNLDSAPDDLRDGLRNNGGGHYNHNLYFESMTSGGNPPTGRLKEAITDRFGRLGTLEDELFQAATAKVFGSGWAWLILSDGKLDIAISPNQDSPLQNGNPNLLLPVDMWEHAYYLQYKQAKTDYVKAYFRVVNWEIVAKRLERAEQA